ncbi:MAG: NAD(P)H-dependent oxidoreductase subunit E [Phycisphaerales bacterium]|nr:MAG: NAD(P)H-dependent oxidoreductase subunit E [Phycisphaerales bacterium]
MIQQATEKVGAVLVVGGGVGGMQASLDLAEAGYKVYLVEKGPSIGGVMAQLDKTFPTNDCAMCTLAPRMVDCGRHLNIEKLTYSEIESIEGAAGNFTVKIRKKARFVDPEKCTGCGECTDRCLVRNRAYLEPGEKTEVSVPPEELDRLASIMEKHKGGRGIIVPVLQEAQDVYNYLPESAVRYLSERLDIPLGLMYRLATFYNAFSLKPKGKHVIRVCMGTSCYVKGGKRILRALEKHLNVGVGGVTEDKQFGLEMVNCVGCCGQSPVVTVDEDIYGYMRQSRVVELIGKYNHSGE